MMDDNTSTVMQRIVIIEPCHSHEEVILPLVELLRETYDVSVLAPQSLLDVDLLSRTKHLYAGLPIRWNQKAPRWLRLLCLPGKYRGIRRIVDSIEPKLIIFNSTHTWIDLLLIAFFFKGVPKVQIIHEFHFFLRPIFRGFYKIFNLNLVISEEVFWFIRHKHNDYQTLDYFLPIFFSGFETACASAHYSQSDDDTIVQLGIFGSVDQTRRNYNGLFQSLATWCKAGHKPCFQMHIVGRLPEAHVNFIKTNKIGHIVHYAEAFVPFEKMFEVLRKVDIVLFLIDASVRDCEVYNRYKITGSSTLIKGFQKVCASSKDFCVDGVLTDKCFFYDDDHVEQLFNMIENGVITKAVVRQMESRYAGNTLLYHNVQKKRLIESLKGIGSARI